MTDMPTVQIDGLSCTMYMLYYSRDMGYNVITITLYSSRDINYKVIMMADSTSRWAELYNVHAVLF